VSCLRTGQPLENAIGILLRGLGESDVIDGADHSWLNRERALPSGNGAVGVFTALVSEAKIPPRSPIGGLAFRDRLEHLNGARKVVGLKTAQRLRKIRLRRLTVEHCEECGESADSFERLHNLFYGS
jgi:hypothetical protein